ncbi:unnamed protein product, partial [Bubo scandiacus]
PAALSPGASPRPPRPVEPRQPRGRSGIASVATEPPAPPELACHAVRLPAVLAAQEPLRRGLSPQRNGDTAGPDPGRGGLGRPGDLREAAGAWRARSSAPGRRPGRWVPSAASGALPRRRFTRRGCAPRPA